MRNINAELQINVAETNVKVFMQAGFFKFDVMNNVLHEHTYTELHFVERGNCEFTINGDVITIHEGEMLIIPSKTFHYHLSENENVRHCAFQIDFPVKKMSIISIPKDIFTALLNEITVFLEKKNSVRMSAYLAVLCSYVIDDSVNTAKNIHDREFLIHEFFSVNYNKKITLSDLANSLNVSKKQAERIIFKYTGNTFRTELSKRRMEAAMQLMKTENISMAEIAERSGYSSYSGFWKAYKASLDKSKT